MRHLLLAVLLVAMTGRGPDTKPEDRLPHKRKLPTQRKLRLELTSHQQNALTTRTGNRTPMRRPDRRIGL
jgi:hypothetical protein